MRLTSIRPQFVEFIPRDLEYGVLYISEKYRTAAHLCACGWCGEKVVTPLSPVDWQVKKEGDLVSLYPSIGNWRLPCKSHYWIRRNRIDWARSFTDREIEQVIAKDDADKLRYVEQVNREKSELGLVQTQMVGAGIWQGLLRLLRKLWKGE